MANRGNVNGRERKDELSRPVRHRKYQYHFLIVCEDQNTEPTYFKAFKSQIPKDTIYLLEVGTGRDPQGVAESAVIERDKLAIEARKTIDEVWIVFDKDDADLNQAKTVRFQEAFAIADRERFNVAYSNEVFELWLLLHLQDVNPAVAIPRTEIYGLLQSVIRSKNGHEKFIYKHGNAEILEKIAEIGDQEAAMRRAEILQDFHEQKAAVDSNPVTYVDRLVKQINKLIVYYSYEG